MLSTLVPQSDIYHIAQFSGTQTTAQALASFDDGYQAGVFMSPVASSTEPLEMPMSQNYCDAIQFDKNGTPWALCSYPDGSVWAQRMVVTSTWNPLFGSYLYCSNYTQILGVPESSSVVSSAPFTITNNTDPSVIAAATPFPGNYPHEIPVTINGTGSTTLTVTDKNGRAESISIFVGNSSCSGPRPHRHRPR